MPTFTTSMNNPECSIFYSYIIPRKGVVFITAPFFAADNVRLLDKNPLRLYNV